MRHAKLVTTSGAESLQELLGIDRLMRNGTRVILQAQGAPLAIGNKSQQPLLLPVLGILDIEPTGLKDTYINGTAAILVV